MNMRRIAGVVLVAGLCLAGQGRASAQCCLSDLFAGCFSCCQKQPRAIAVAPVAPVAAPIMAPVIAPVPAPPPPPVMVPMQQTSYVPETTYRTEYRCVPVTSYKPSCEIDPCTGCQVECMRQMTEYVQQPVSVPVTQYRAVTTTKYVQMQPGGGYAPVAAPGGYPGVAPPAPAAGPAQSPFSGVQTAPQAWGAAGSDVAPQTPPQAAPTFAPPALPSGGQSPAPITPGPSYQYYAPTAQATQQLAPQAGTYAGPQVQYAPQQYQHNQQYQQPPQAQQQQPQPQQPHDQQQRSVEPPALNQAPSGSRAPSLKPIPELPRTSRPDAASDATSTSGSGMRAFPDSYRAPAPPAPSSQQGMPVLPGTGPGPETGAFPRLLEPTSHTTSWGPSDGGAARVQYPTAALPAWRNSQQ